MTNKRLDERMLLLKFRRVLHLLSAWEEEYDIGIAAESVRQ